MTAIKALVKELHRQTEDFIGKDVDLSGWIKNIRAQKDLCFIDFNDGSFFKGVQLVAERSGAEDFEKIQDLSNGSAINVRGLIVETPNSKQKFELQVKSICLLADSSQDYPLQPKRHTPEFLRTIAHLRPRTNLFSAVFRVRSQAAFAIHQFFNERGFVYVHTPIITGNDSEGAGEMFRVTTMDMLNPHMTEDGAVDYKKDFFSKETHLTVSGQLNAEAYALAFNKVYTFGPTFRAEDSNTTRHAAEFWMIEPEIAFADLQDDMELAEDMLKYIINFVMETCPEEMDFFNSFVDKGLIKRLENVVSNDFGVITYTEAIEKLKESKIDFKYPVDWGCDLQTEHEKYLTEVVFEKPVFVIDYPKDIKAFYMKLNEDGKTVAAMDCLVPGIGEIIGGSQREDDLDKLLARMNEMGLKTGEYDWYLELRKFGGPAHAGFGLGFERMIMYLTGVSNIRDVIPFPRTPGHAEY